MKPEMKIHEIERELELEKARFRDATSRGMDAVKTDLSVRRLLQAYPIQSAVLMLAGGYFAARAVQKKIEAQSE